MILKWGDFFSTSRRRFVRRKWPKWLVPICISNPSLVSYFVAVCITPALFTKISNLLYFDLNSFTNNLTELRSERFNFKNYADPARTSFTIFAASFPLFSLNAWTTVAPALATSFAVSKPIPVFAPVMIMT